MFKNILRISFIIGVICALLVVSGTWFYINNFQTRNNHRTLIEVRPGATVRDISIQARDRHVVSLGNALNIYLRLTSRTPRPGKHVIPAHIPLTQLIEILTQPDNTLYFLTVVEGSTPLETLRLINTNTRFSGSEISLKDAGPVLSNTHAYEPGELRHKVYQRLRAKLTEQAQKIWKNALTKDVVASPEELIVLASIIEKETAIPEERRRIAGVFVNRLRKGMRLQADCTVVYGLCLVNPERSWNQGLTKENLRTPSPYNTYMNAGLPPAAIANPSIASLKAAANPLETKDLYFVADGNGGHVFSQTRTQHASKHKNWRRIRKHRKAAQQAPRKKPARKSA